MKPKYPDVNVALVGEDGNAFAIIGRVQRELKRAGIDQDEIRLFQQEAMGGNYDNLLGVVQNWVSVDNGQLEMTEEEADAEWDAHWAKLDAERDERGKAVAEENDIDYDESEVPF